MCGIPTPHNHDADIREWEASLRRAFVDHGMKSIGLDGWSGKFLWASARYGQLKGWLDDAKEHGSDEEQYTSISLRLTPLGRTHFGVAP
jgi:hypothetical protein